jgi:hypothetical protein
MYKNTFKIIIALSTFFSIFLVKVHSANWHNFNESLVEEKIYVEEIRAELEASSSGVNRGYDHATRGLFLRKYHDQFTELDETIKKARYEYYNKCTHGAGLFGIFGRSVLYGISLGRICIGRDYKLLESKNLYYSSYSLPNEIFCDEGTMERFAKQKLLDMQQELKEVKEKIAKTSFFKKILCYII